MKLKSALFLFCTFLLSANLISAQDDAHVSVKAEINRAFITVGDPVEYTVTIKHDPNVQVLSSVKPPSDEILKIKKIEDINRKDGKNIVEGRKYTLTAFRLGEFILEPVKIEYRVADQPPQSIETERIFLTVKSVAEGEEKVDIRGVKSVISIPESYKWLILAAIVLILLITGWIAYVVLHKAKQAGPTVAEVPLSAEDEALLHLSQLFDSDLIRRGKTKDYYLRLSEILRHYLERRYQVKALEATTYEIARNLIQQSTLKDELRQKLIEVLEATDLAKFAKWVPTPAEIISLNQRSKQIIEDCRPNEVSRGI